jgi:large subunit ribosomal protein L31
MCCSLPFWSGRVMLADWHGTPPGSGSRHARIWRPGTTKSIARLASAAAVEGIPAVKNDIHPNYALTEVTCTCGNTFTTRSTAKSGHLRAEVCSACHPFYTGKQKIMDVGGRVDKFEKRFGKRVRNA